VKILRGTIMPNRLGIAVIVAVFFGLLAAYGVYSFLRRQQVETEALKRATQEIVVAAKEIPPGAKITPDMVRLAPYPKGSVPSGSVSSPEKVVGRVAKVNAVSGEPLLESKLTTEGTALTVLLTPGNRAIAVRVDEIVGVSGFIAPNDRVGVIATVTPPGNGGGDKVSKIVLQNKRVLSVAQNVEQKEGKPQVARSITMELTPEETEKLSVAALEGAIVLSLRAVGDDTTVQTRGSTKRDLLTLAAAPKANVKARPAPDRDKFRVEVYSGTERKVVEF
jgi:pilus assembly protein CpaB